MVGGASAEIPHISSAPSVLTPIRFSLSLHAFHDFARSFHSAHGLRISVDMDLKIYGIRKSYSGYKSSPRSADRVARSFIFHLPSFNRSIFQSFIFPKNSIFQSFIFNPQYDYSKRTSRFGHLSLPCMHGSVIPSGHKQQLTQTLPYADQKRRGRACCIVVM